jgi:hypothetical protein
MLNTCQVCSLLLYTFPWVTVHLFTAGSCVPTVLPKKTAVTGGAHSPVLFSLGVGFSMPYFLSNSSALFSSPVSSTPLMASQIPKSHFQDLQKSEKEEQQCLPAGWPPSWHLTKNLGHLRSYHNHVDNQCANDPIKMTHL